MDDLEHLKVDCPKLLEAKFGFSWNGRCVWCGGEVEQSEEFLCEHEGKKGRFSYATCIECGHRFPIKHLGYFSMSGSTSNSDYWRLDANTYSVSAI